MSARFTRPCIHRARDSKLIERVAHSEYSSLLYSSQRILKEASLIDKRIHAKLSKRECHPLNA